MGRTAPRSFITVGVSWASGARRVCGWRKIGRHFHSIFWDTNVDGNTPADPWHHRPRSTGADNENPHSNRKSSWVIGGLRRPASDGGWNPDVCHMNEGHSAFSWY